MLDYSKLTEELNSILSAFTREEIKEWIEFDKDRLANEGFINDEKMIMKVEEPIEPEFKSTERLSSLIKPEKSIEASDEEEEEQN